MAASTTRLRRRRTPPPSSLRKPAAGAGAHEYANAGFASPQPTVQPCLHACGLLVFETYLLRWSCSWTTAKPSALLGSRFRLEKRPSIILLLALPGFVSLSSEEQLEPTAA